MMDVACSADSGGIDSSLNAFHSNLQLSIGAHVHKGAGMSLSNKLPLMHQKNHNAGERVSQRHTTKHTESLVHATSGDEP
ncbi:hypothetical protein WMY93_032062, partial [Mugilogobius chulae]